MQWNKTHVLGSLATHVGDLVGVSGFGFLRGPALAGVAIWGMKQETDLFLSLSLSVYFSKIQLC